MITADLLKKITTPDGNEVDHGRSWQTVGCPYCLDNRHLAVEGQWIVDRRIPHDVDVERYYMPVRDFRLIYIPCDCMADWRGRGKDDRPQPRTFREYFGEPIKTHWYGLRLMQYRHELQRKLQEGYERGQDGHLHQTEADAMLAGEDVLDALERQYETPPEHELEFENYLEVDDSDADLPPF